MRRPLGDTDVTASGGTITLIGRRSSGRQQVGPDLALNEALDRLGWSIPAGMPGGALRPADGTGPFLAAGSPMTWHYRRTVDAARVVRDDERGLVVWIPSGAGRHGAVPAVGGGVRDIPLQRRFVTRWVMGESVWRGPGIVRVAPTGRPWSVWFFRDDRGAYAGTYVNLELPHLRPLAGDPVPARTHTADLVLDVWVDAGPAGEEDIWLKDADELDAAVAQGRCTSGERDAVRALADHACRNLLDGDAWPMNEGWQTWRPDAASDTPIPLPDNEVIAWSRARSGASSLEG